MIGCKSLRRVEYSRGLDNKGIERIRRFAVLIGAEDMSNQTLSLVSPGGVWSPGGSQGPSPHRPGSLGIGAVATKAPQRPARLIACAAPQKS